MGGTSIAELDMFQLQLNLHIESQKRLITLIHHETNYQKNKKKLSPIYFGVLDSITKKKDTSQLSQIVLCSTELEFLYHSTGPK